MRVVAILSLAAFALCACASEPVPAARWSKTGASYDGFVADRAQCLRRTREEAKPYMVDDTRAPGALGGVPRLIGDVETELGIDDPALLKGMSQEIFARCMNARGYHADPKGFAPPDGDEVAMGY